MFLNGTGSVINMVTSTINMAIKTMSPITRMKRLGFISYILIIHHG